MAISSALNERDMRLPDTPEGKCVNHPTVDAVRLHLCSPCLKRWEKSVLDYESIQPGSVLSDD